MDAKARILAIRLMEKSKKHEQFAKRILSISEDKDKYKKTNYNNLFLKEK